MDASVARLICKAIDLYYGQPALLLQGVPTSQAVWSGRESFQASHRRLTTTEGDTCFRKPEIENFRADYAKRADFCDIFEKDMKRLYLLAFLLTADHKQAEHCFASTVEEAFREQAVFKEWARSWVNRALLEKALEIVSPLSNRPSEKLDSWRAGLHETHGQDKLNAVAKLAPLERFVFVMSVLERYSDRDCALLLGCNPNKVSQARRKALRRLADFASVVPPRRQGSTLHRLEVSA
jgi:DNA-directed RNA polymerase specialized sigma24 family protein